MGGSFINYYMYHGGTTFARTADGPFIATSYDYNAPLDEFDGWAEMRCTSGKKILIRCPGSQMHAYIIIQEANDINNDLLPQWLQISETSRGKTCWLKRQFGTRLFRVPAKQSPITSLVSGTIAVGNAFAHNELFETSANATIVALTIVKSNPM